MTKNDARRYNYNGQNLTIKEWSRVLGIQQGAIYRRLHAGWPVEKVFGEPICSSKQSWNRRIFVDYNGEKKTLGDVARETKIPYSILYHRIRKKAWSVKKALSVPIGREEPVYKVDGECHTRREWLTKAGITVGAFRNRLERDWSIERALVSKKYTKNKPAKIEFEGETHSMAEWGRIVGFSRACISNRLKKGWSIGDALTAPLGYKPGCAA